MVVYERRPGAGPRLLEDRTGPLPRRTGGGRTAPAALHASAGQVGAALLDGAAERREGTGGVREEFDGLVVRPVEVETGGPGRPARSPSPPSPRRPPPPAPRSN
ncbi:hypothetical protein AB0D54_08915 [Streptomyces xanthophaeus]|uniref:hypothetical protein n=1 Tax=Streptomyces xanthophaeus TaxID=67385 RepID=UPI003437406B